MRARTKKNPHGAGRPKGKPGTVTTEGDRRNVTLARLDATALNAFQEKLSAHLGIDVTLSQCVRWLVNHAEKTLVNAEKTRDD